MAAHLAQTSDACRQYLLLVGDSSVQVEKRAKAASELADHIEQVASHTSFSVLINDFLKVFSSIMKETEPNFISESPYQLLRKHMLECIHRIPANEVVRPLVKTILVSMFRLIEIDNEENVLICLRIIIEMHKQYRPQISQEIHQFLLLVKKIYDDVQKSGNLGKIFEPQTVLRIKDIAEVDIPTLLNETYTSITVHYEKRDGGGAATSVVLPRATMSLKVMAELPIIVVLMYQLYKNNVINEVSDFIPLIMKTILLQPSPAQRSNSNFNKEIFCDFVAAQIKTLSFIAFIIRFYQEIINQHHEPLMKGMIVLFQTCPPEVAHLRKELLIAARHILATDLRKHFVPIIDKLFDENLLIGAGWTAHDSLRPLAYSTLADLVHHVRNQLKFNDLCLAVNLFSKNIMDDTLPCSIQTMSCKLLLNLVECIRSNSETENNEGRDLLMRMLEVFVIKFKSITELQLPILLEKCKTDSKKKDSKDNQIKTTSNDGETSGDSKSSDEKSPLPDFSKEKDVEKIIPGVPNPPNYLVSECRALVKTLICGVKTITWGTTTCRTNQLDNSAVRDKKLTPKETLVFVRLVKYGLSALDIYTINVTPNGLHVIRPASLQTCRTKEEKEVLEHFGGVFTMMYPQTFKEIFVNTIEFMVDRMQSNYSIQVVANSFLANVQTSATFATILVDFLLTRLPEMGSNSERSALYLKLFKLVFGSVSLFSQENEPMLKPHLHSIVNQSMELAMTGKDPYNYFLLLRALFRSIGGGSHDHLYQEFLPLLPNLLQGLNSLQSGPHKQHMKDLFVELCLTVPVRLSSLLPYLPMLMDPLVSALNGSPSLVSQGLRTLELCVDNLQPDFLYEHIQPVRAELMQALWTTLRNPSDQIAHIAFRVLGKFGGANRKMLSEPQKLNYLDRSCGAPTMSLVLEDLKSPISLPVEMIIDTANSSLKISNTDEYIKAEALEVIKCYLIASMNLDEDVQTVSKIIKHQNFKIGPIINLSSTSLYKSVDSSVRKIHEKALLSLFIGASTKSLEESTMPFLEGVIQQYVMVACSHQSGPFPLLSNDKLNKFSGLDPHILIDSICSVLGHEDSELENSGIIGLKLIVKTATVIMSDLQRACQLPLFEYLSERITALCYERAWYSKMGGCIGIKFTIVNLSLNWVLEHQYQLLKALLFVLMDLTGEVSSGAVDQAKENIRLLLKQCAKKLDPEKEDLLDLQKKSISEVTHELMRQVTSPNTLVREQSVESLKYISEILNVPLSELITPHKDVLQDMLPPKKHLLRHQPINAQIGIMEGNTFCAAIDDRFSITVNSVVEHKIYFEELLNICEADDAALHKYPCYKSATSLAPLRCSAMRALACCHHIEDKRHTIFKIFFEGLKSEKKDIQDTSVTCLKKFLFKCPIENLNVEEDINNLLEEISGPKSCSMQFMNNLISLAKIIPDIFKEKHVDSLLERFISWMDKAPEKQGAKTEGFINCVHVQICVAAIDVLHLLPAATSKYLDQIVHTVMKCEKEILTECSSPFRKSVRAFLLRYPNETVDLFLSDSLIIQEKYVRFFISLIEHKESLKLRSYLETQDVKLSNLCKSVSHSNAEYSDSTKNLLQFVGIKLVRILAVENGAWLSQQVKIVSALLTVWVSSNFQDKHQHVDSIDYEQWEEPQLLVECLILFFQAFPKKLELLFQTLKCFVHRYATSMQFVKVFLAKTVVETYSVQWKRDAFFKFVEIFHNPDWCQDLKANILKHVLLPSFAYAFEKGEEALIEGPESNGEENSDQNIVHCFIAKIIDPEKSNACDSIRILVLQFASLLVEYASHHIHDGTSSNKKDGKEGNKLRKLMTYAWPCLLTKTCVDPSTRYHGHLLLCHIIAKFAIHKRIVLQVFHSLLKSYGVEARNVVKQALNVVVPTLPNRMEDSNVSMLVFWTRKIIVEEGHCTAHLTHILQLIVRHFKVFYTVRSGLIMYMNTSIHRLAFTPSSNMDNRKLAVEVCEVLIKWEIMRIKEEEESKNGGDGVVDAKRARRLVDNKPMEKYACDSVVNSLMRIACQVNEASTTGQAGELLSKKCVQLIKLVLRNDVWPIVDLKLSWLDKLLQSVEANSPNYGNIMCGLELLTILTGFLKRQELLSNLRIMQKGLILCLRCSNTRVIRTLNIFLTKLMTIFPTEHTASTVASKHEELDPIYAAASKIVYEGLSNYDKVVERSQNSSPSQLFGTLMILKAACVQNPGFIDRLLSIFYRVLQRMAKEHLTPPASDTNTISITCELLILSLDLVKNRVGCMGAEMRKSFIGTILTTLIEKSTDSKVIKAITKMVEDWVKTKQSLSMINQAPSVKEKVILLVKLMSNIEKRFPDEKELQSQFLELVKFVYCDEDLRGTEITVKLEGAFMYGLRCPQHSIRQQFMTVFDSSISRSIEDRLMYILQSQSWESIGTHFWVKQCIQLLLVLTSKSSSFSSSNSLYSLPSITNILSTVDKNEAGVFQNEESQVIKMEIDQDFTEFTIDTLINKQKEFYNLCTDIKMNQFACSLSELCHSNTNLSYHLWIDLFPRLYKVLPERTQIYLNQVMSQFLISPQHLPQKDVYPSAANCFLEAICKCLPQVSLKPSIIKYLGKSHNLWHRSVLMLEQLAIDGSFNNTRRQPTEYEFEVGMSTGQNEVLDCLCELYSLLKEEDMVVGIWSKRAKYPETVQALAYEQHGHFEHAQTSFESCMNKARQEHNTQNCSLQQCPEYNLWINHWIRCAKELNQWEQLLEFCNVKGHVNPELAMECAWHVPNWAIMKDAITQVDGNCAKEMNWKVNLYKGYVHVCNPDDQHFQPAQVDKFVDLCGNNVIREWRRLPHIVSHIHVQYLQASQQVMELYEASQIHQNLQANAATTRSGAALHDMKAIVKTWRNRLPMISDDLSHWSDIFTWRHHHYQYIVSHYNNQAQQDASQSTNAMLGVHASAQAIIHFGKIARKHSQTNVCLDQLSRIHTIASVPIVDCFNKIRQQVKCYLQMSSVLGKNELQEGLEVIESTNLKYFTKEMTAEFYALKGMFLAQIGRSEDANKAFSAAVQMHDTLVKAWALWGDYLEALFTRDRNIQVGVSAITCFLHACRHQNESKSRKYLAKVLWLLTFDEPDKQTLAEAVDRYNVGVPPIQWLTWIPQLLTCLIRNEGKLMLNLLTQVGRMYPQAVYFPIRTLYLTLKLEQRERVKTLGASATTPPPTTPQTPNPLGTPQPITPQSAEPNGAQITQSGPPIRATASMWRCSKIMHTQRELHPSILSSLEGIVDQFVWFRERWHEEVLRQLRQALTKCYTIAFESRQLVSEASITPHTRNFIKKIVSTFGTGLEQGNTSVSNPGSAASESLARRAQLSRQDPVFQRMKQQFTTDFDFTQSSCTKLHTVMNKLKKWIKILEAKTVSLPKSHLIEEKCRFLSNFSPSTAEVELPGEFLLPKASHSHYYVRIARFMPVVQIVDKYGTAARRIYIRGQNGKIYPYLVVSDRMMTESRREERVLQLLRMLNHFLYKQKETCRRLLNFTVPRVVAVSPHTQLIEDNLSSISLSSVYKQLCMKRGVEADAPIARYYERVATVQARGNSASHQVLREILKEVQNNTVPKTLLKEWALEILPNATEFWTFRKNLTLQLALAGLAEFVLHLTRTNIDMMYVHQDSGFLSIAYFKFDVDDQSGDLHSNRPVPFRLTPNIAELLAPTGVNGPLAAAMLSAARCFVQPQYKFSALLKAILRDEYITWHKKQQDEKNPGAHPVDMEGDMLIQMVQKATSAITTRLQNLASLDGADSKVSTLVAAANSLDNLCRMDPAWHPWL